MQSSKTLSPDRLRPLLFFVALTAAFASFGTPASAQVNLVQNGSFESPQVPPASFSSDDGRGLYYYGFGAPGIFPPWANDGSAIIHRNRPGGWVAQDGNQWVNIDSNASGGWQQTLATTPGESYTLEFWYSPDPLSAAPFFFGDDDSMRILWDGAVVDVVDVPATTSSFVEWYPYSYTVTATSSSTVLRFEDAQTSQNYVGPALDNVSVVAADGSAPVADAGLDFSVDEGTAFVMLDGSGSSDPDGDPLTYSWLQIAGPSVALSDPTAQQPTFTAPLVGIGGEMLTFELSVSANGESAMDSVTVTVDNLNQTPIVTITSPADGDVSGSTAINVTADVVDEDATTVTSTPAGIAPGNLLAGGGMVSGSLALANEGSNDLIVSVTDAGGLNAGTSLVVYRDTVAPLVDIAPAEGTVVSAPLASFGVTVTDQTSTDVTIDGNFAGTAEVPGGDVYGVSSILLAGTIALWEEGPNSIVVQATDAAGNVTSVTRTVILDSTAPLVAISDPANGACYGVGSSVDIPIVATIDDATATEVTGALAGSLPAGGGTLTGTFTLQEGVNSIAVIAQDNAGAGLVASDTVSVTLDTIAPAVEITAPDDGACVSGSVEFHASASDVLPGTVASTTFFVDGAALAPAALYTVDTTALSDGPHELRVDATDSCGNVSSTFITVEVDNTAPDVTLSNPFDMDLVAGTIDFDAFASDGGSGLAEITMTAANSAPTVDGSETYASPVASAVVTSQVDTLAASGGLDGDLELEVTARDCAGNEATVAITVVVDNTAPAKSILSPADGSVVRCEMKVQADASDPNLASVQFVIDGTSTPVMTAPPFEATFDTRERLDGEMPITMIATDFAGNTSTCTISVTVDNLKVRIMPRRLRLKSRWGWHSVLARIEGQSAGLLTELDPADVTLCVPGGSPIPATHLFGYQGGWWCGNSHHWWHRGHRHGHRHGCQGAESKVFAKFNRKLLIGALRAAGHTSGKVELTIKATVDGETFVIGSSKIRVKG